MRLRCLPVPFRSCSSAPSRSFCRTAPALISAGSCLVRCTATDSGGVGLSALFARWRLGFGVPWAAFVAGAGVPLAVLGKLVRDLIADPTSHNLWPFELAIAAAVGLAAGLVGAFAGWIMIVLVPRRDT